MRWPTWTLPRTHPRLLLSLAVFALALVMRFVFWAEIRGTPLDRWHLLGETDMATYLHQADQMARGDWLATHPYHPYHSWQNVAPPEKWLEWYGPHAFHQAPGYSFLIGATSEVVSDPLAFFKSLQLLLGAGSSVLVFWIAQRLAGISAGWMAGTLMAVYGPLFYLEAQILREGPAIFMLLGILLLLIQHLGGTARTAGSALRPLAPSSRKTHLTIGILGVLLGAFAIFHEMAVVMIPVSVLALVLNHRKDGFRRAALSLSLLAIGMLLGFSPLLARNLAVGASPFAVSCRQVINFVQANEADAADGGSTFSVPGPNVVAILDQADRSMLRAIQGVAKTYEGRVDRAVQNWGKRFAAIWKLPEEPDNTSFYFYRDHTAILKPCPSFAHLFPLGVAGALAVFGSGMAEWRSRRAGRRPANNTTRPQAAGSSNPNSGPVESRGRSLPSPSPARAIWSIHPSGHLTLLLYLALVAGSLSFVHTVARFRLYVVPFFIVYAAILLVLCWRSLSARRFKNLAGLLAAVLAGWGFQRVVSDVSIRELYRPMDYACASMLAVQSGDVATAVSFTEEAVQRHFKDAGLYVLLASSLERQGEKELAAQYYGRALELDPNRDEARQGLDRLRPETGNP